MLGEKLAAKKLILGSSSPRRQRFLREMGLEFEIRPAAVEEVYPENLKAGEISDYLAKLKADALKDKLTEEEILLTSDTVVWHRGKSLEKASSEEEAYAMLEAINGDCHEVITSVCFTSSTGQRLVRSTTKVWIAHLTEAEIRHYISNFKPFDKAGAYGIQEWYGLVGVEGIEGSYTNVVGLPTELVYRTLMKILEEAQSSSDLMG